LLLGALAVIADAKDHYCLTLLTINSMPAPLTACLQAQDQLQALHLSLGMNTGEYSSSSACIHVLTAVEFGNT
jgi:hypothetical protein